MENMDTGVLEVEEDVNCTDEDFICLLEEHLKKERQELGLNQIDIDSDEDVIISSITVHDQPSSSNIRSESADCGNNLRIGVGGEIKEEDVKPPDNVSRVTHLKNLLLVIDECMIQTKKQMNVLLDKEFKLCLLKNNVLQFKNSKQPEARKFDGSIDLEEKAAPGEPTLEFIQQFRAPYFKDIHYFAAPKNKDALELLKTYQIRYFKPWSNLDVINLQQSIRKSIIKTYISLIYRKVSEANQLDHAKKLDHLKTINYFKTAPLSSFITNKIEANVDWVTVSDNVRSKFTPSECKKMWHLFAKPTISKKKWSEEEVKLLRQLINVHESQNWNEIAKDLNTNRSGFQCFLYYLKFINKHVSGSWSEHEVDFLENVIKQSTYGKKIVWNKVCYYLESKSFRQIFHKWNSANPSVRKGQFNPKEDQLLLTLIHKFNMNFDTAAKVVKNRTSSQLKERYENTLNPNTKYIYGEWTEEEDRQLLQLVEEYGQRNWAQIATKMKSRSRIQIRHRYKCLITKFAKNPNLDISAIKRYNRPRNSKTRQQSKRFLSKLKEEKYRKLKFKDMKTVVDSVYKERKKRTSNQVDLELIAYFEKQINTDILNLEGEFPVADYSLGDLAEELVNILTILKSNMIFSNDKLQQLFQDAEIQKLGSCGKEVVKLFNENYLIREIFDQQRAPCSPQGLNLLPATYNSLQALWLLMSMRRKRPDTDYKLYFEENSLSLKDKALLDWNQRIHSIFLWSGFLSVNKIVKPD